MTDQNSPKPVTLDDIYDMLQKCPPKPKISWISTVIQIVISILVVGTAAVIYVGATSEKESKEAAERIEAPLVEKISNMKSSTESSIDRMEKSTEESIQRLETATTSKIAEVLKLMEGSERRTRSDIEVLNGNLDKISGSQRDIREKLHVIDVRQATMETDIQYLKAARQ